jgi:hypothetical protein
MIFHLHFFCQKMIIIYWIICPFWHIL